MILCPTGLISNCVYGLNHRIGGNSAKLQPPLIDFCLWQQPLVLTEEGLQSCSQLGSEEHSSAPGWCLWMFGSLLSKLQLSSADPQPLGQPAVRSGGAWPRTRGASLLWKGKEPVSFQLWCDLCVAGGGSSGPNTRHGNRCSQLTWSGQEVRRFIFISMSRRSGSWGLRRPGPPPPRQLVFICLIVYRKGRYWGRCTFEVYLRLLKPRQEPLHWISGPVEAKGSRLSLMMRHKLCNVCISTVCFLLTSCPACLWQVQLGCIHPGLALHFSVFTGHVVTWPFKAVLCEQS